MYDFPCILSLGWFASVTIPVLKNIFCVLNVETREVLHTYVTLALPPTPDKRLEDFSLERENGSREKTLRCPQQKALSQGLDGEASVRYPPPLSVELAISFFYMRWLLIIEQHTQ